MNKSKAMMLFVEGSNDLLVLSTIIEDRKGYKEIKDFLHNWPEELDKTWNLLGRKLDKSRKKRLTNNSNILLMISGEGKPNIYFRLIQLIVHLSRHKYRLQLDNVFIVVDADNATINQIIQEIIKRLNNKLKGSNVTPNIHNPHYATLILQQQIKQITIHVITISHSLNSILNTHGINPKNLSSQLILSNTQFINYLLNNSCINDLLQLI
jgi:hypothetical protein